MYTGLKVYVLRCFNRTIRPTGDSLITDTFRSAIKTGDNKDNGTASVTLFQ